MRYQRSQRFDSDIRSLPREHREMFRDCFPAFSRACDTYAVQGGSFRWPARFRVKQMKGHGGIWEMTWSFASPDGRATFEFDRDEDGPVLRWRRIGYHGIYTNP